VNFFFVPQPFDPSLGTLLVTRFTVSLDASTSVTIFCPLGCTSTVEPTFFVKDQGIEIDLSSDGSAPVTAIAGPQSGNAGVPPGASVQMDWVLSPEIVGHPFSTGPDPDPSPVITLEGAFRVGGGAFEGSPFVLSNISGSSLESVSVYYEYGIGPHAVPESSTWAMMLIGFAGLGFTFRRKVSFAT
jgi:hypothetical protein